MKKLVLSILASITMLNAIDNNVIDIIQSDNPLQKAITEQQIQTKSKKFTFQPVQLDPNKCDLNFGDFEKLKDDIDQYINEVIEDIGSGAKEFMEAEKRKMLQASLIKIPATIEFMLVKNGWGYMGQVASDMTDCITSATTAGVTTDTGGGGGDQGQTMKFGVDLKELTSAVGCIEDAFYPPEMAQEDLLLLEKLHKKWKKTINTVLNTTVKATLSGLTAEKSNICTLQSQEKNKDMAAYLDSVGGLVLLDNQMVEGAFDMQEAPNPEKKYKKNADDTVVGMTESTFLIKADEVNTNPMFTDIEPQNYQKFISDIVAMKKRILAQTSFLNVNPTTVVFLGKFLDNYIMEIKDKDLKLYKTIYKLFKDQGIPEQANIYMFELKMAETYPEIERLFVKEVIAGRYPEIGIGDAFGTTTTYPDAYTMVKSIDKERVKLALNQMFLFTHSKNQFYKNKKFRLYYSNIVKNLKQNQPKTRDVLRLDRRHYRKNIELEQQNTALITYRKVNSVKQEWIDFCLENSATIDVFIKAGLCEERE